VWSSLEITSQNDKSIITRIETLLSADPNQKFIGQNDKSIITRIETIKKKGIANLYKNVKMTNPS